MSYETWKEKVSEFKTIDVRKLRGNFFPGLQRQASALGVGEGLTITSLSSLIRFTKHLPS